MGNAYIASDLYHIQLACERETTKPLPLCTLYEVRNAALRLVKAKVGQGSWFKSVYSRAVGGCLGQGTFDSALRERLVQFCKALTDDPKEKTRKEPIEVTLIPLLTGGKQNEAVCDGLIIETINRAKKDDAVVVITADASPTKQKKKIGILSAMKQAKTRGAKLFLVYAPRGTSKDYPKPSEKFSDAVDPQNILRLTFAKQECDPHPVAKLEWLDGTQQQTQ